MNCYVGIFFVCLCRYKIFKEVWIRDICIHVGKWLGLQRTIVEQSTKKKTELENSFGNTSIVENQYVEIWDNMVSFRIEMWLSVMSFFGMLVVGI